MTSLAALGVSLAVSLVVIGGQQSSGRSDLTERATEFVRMLKARESGRDGRTPVEVTEFLRPEDRSSRAALEGLKRLEGTFGSASEGIDIAQVEILGAGKARTLAPLSVGGLQNRRGRSVEIGQIDWIRGADGRWYLDPEGL